MRCQSGTRGNSLLTIGEAAQLAGVPRDTIHDAIYNGRLPFIRVDGRRMVDPSDLRRFARGGGRPHAQ